MYPLQAVVAGPSAPYAVITGGSSGIGREIANEVGNPRVRVCVQALTTGTGVATRSCCGMCIGCWQMWLPRQGLSASLFWFWLTTCRATCLAKHKMLWLAHDKAAHRCPAFPTFTIRVHVHCRGVASWPVEATTSCWCPGERRGSCLPPRSLGKLPGAHHHVAWTRADTRNRTALSFCSSCDW